jgi:hypothetical protein
MHSILPFILSFCYLVAITTSSIQPRSEWARAGCFAEPTNPKTPRLLSAKKGLSPTVLSFATCARFCANYLIFGVENGTLVSINNLIPNNKYADICIKCYCANTLGAGGTTQAASACNIHCPANPAEFCGGKGKINIFARNSLAPTPGPPGLKGSTGASGKGSGDGDITRSS